MHARVGAAAPAGGPTTVLVHGLGVSSRYMVPLARTLALDFRVHAVDLPGFGLSSKPQRSLTVPELAQALAAWLARLGLEEAVIVANSFGCQVVAELMAVHAPPSRAVVLLAPTVDPEARSTLEQLGRWLRTVAWEKQSLACVIYRDYRDAGLGRVRDTARFALEHPIESKLPALHAPLLVLRGTRDSVTPQRWAERATALAPCGRLELIPGAAHCLNYSAPQESAALIARFVAEVA